MEGFNEGFGGRMVFRVNDAGSEAISSRGVDARSIDRAPAGYREEIRHLLKIAKEEDRSLRDILSTEAFATKITCYTYDNKPITLTEGATALDFAGKIHGNLAIGAQEAEVRDRISGKNKRRISLFEPLPSLVFVRVKSCIKKGEEVNDAHPLRINPSWLLFVRTSHGREAIVKYLRQNKQRSVKQGKEYFERLCQIFSIAEDDLMTALKELYNSKNYHRAIGRGDINPLKAVDALYEKQREFKFEIVLPDVPQAAAEFGKKLGTKINIADYKTTGADEAAKTANVEATLVSIDKTFTTYDLFKTVLKISNEGFDIVLK